MSEVKKRFIAGAVCPRCAELDTIVMYRRDGQEFRECVDCGFEDKLIFKPRVNELETRVNKTEEEKQRETQVIRLIDPSK